MVYFKKMLLCCKIAAKNWKLQAIYDDFPADYQIQSWRHGMIDPYICACLSIHIFHIFHIYPYIYIYMYVISFIYIHIYPYIRISLYIYGTHELHICIYPWSSHIYSAKVLSLTLILLSPGFFSRIKARRFQVQTFHDWHLQEVGKKTSPKPRRKIYTVWSTPTIWITWAVSKELPITPVVKHMGQPAQIWYSMLLRYIMMFVETVCF